MSAREPSIHPHVVGAGVTLTGPVELMVKFPQKGLTRTILSLLNHQLMNGTPEDRELIATALEDSRDQIQYMVARDKGAQ